MPLFRSARGQQVDYGGDITVLPDLDASLSLQSGPRVLADALARMLLTPTGNLEFHPNDGVDLRAYLNDTISDEGLARLQAAVRAQMERDPRVLDAQVEVAYLAGERRLNVRVQVRPGEEGPFAFVLAVTDLTATLQVTES